MMNNGSVQIGNNGILLGSGPDRDQTPKRRAQELNLVRILGDGNDPLFVAQLVMDPAAPPMTVRAQRSKSGALLYFEDIATGVKFHGYDASAEKRRKRDDPVEAFARMLTDLGLDQLGLDATDASLQWAFSQIEEPADLDDQMNAVEYIAKSMENGHFALAAGEQDLQERNAEIREIDAEMKRVLLMQENAPERLNKNLMKFRDYALIGASVPVVVGLAANDMKIRNYVQLLASGLRVLFSSARNNSSTIFYLYYITVYVLPALDNLEKKDAVFERIVDFFSALLFGPIESTKARPVVRFVMMMILLILRSGSSYQFMIIEIFLLGYGEYRRRPGIEPVAKGPMGKLGNFVESIPEGIFNRFASMVKNMLGGTEDELIKTNAKMREIDAELKRAMLRLEKAKGEEPVPPVVRQELVLTPMLLHRPAVDRDTISNIPLQKRVYNPLVQVSDLFVGPAALFLAHYLPRVERGDTTKVLNLDKQGRLQIDVKNKSALFYGMHRFNDVLTRRVNKKVEELNYDPTTFTLRGHGNVDDTESDPDSDNDGNGGNGGNDGNNVRNPSASAAKPPSAASPPSAAATKPPSAAGRTQSNKSAGPNLAPTKPPSVAGRTKSNPPDLTILVNLLDKLQEHRIRFREISSDNEIKVVLGNSLIHLMNHEANESKDGSDGILGVREEVPGAFLKAINTEPGRKLLELYRDMITIFPPKSYELDMPLNDFFETFGYDVVRNKLREDTITIKEDEACYSFYKYLKNIVYKDDPIDVNGEIATEPFGAEGAFFQYQASYDEARKKIDKRNNDDDERRKFENTLIEMAIERSQTFIDNGQAKQIAEDFAEKERKAAAAAKENPIIAISDSDESESSESPSPKGGTGGPGPKAKAKAKRSRPEPRPILTSRIIKTEQTSGDVDPLRFELFEKVQDVADERARPEPSMAPLATFASREAAFLLRDESEMLIRQAINAACEKIGVVPPRLFEVEYRDPDLGQRPGVALQVGETLQSEDARAAVVRDDRSAERIAQRSEAASTSWRFSTIYFWKHIVHGPRLNDQFTFTTANVIAGNFPQESFSSYMNKIDRYVTFTTEEEKLNKEILNTDNSKTVYPRTTLIIETLARFAAALSNLNRLERSNVVTERATQRMGSNLERRRCLEVFAKDPEATRLAIQMLSFAERLEET